MSLVVYMMTRIHFAICAQVSFAGTAGAGAAVFTADTACLPLPCQPEPPDLAALVSSFADGASPHPPAAAKSSPLPEVTAWADDSAAS